MKHPVFDKSWSAEVQRVYDHDMQEIWDKSIAGHIFNMYHNQLEIYKSLVPEKAKKILDVGCAQATLALLLAEDGLDVTAVDLRADFLDYAKTRWTHGKIKFLQGNVFDIQLEKGFDVIFANQILEHLVYPKEFIEKLSSLLEANGLIIMTTPNGEYINNRLPAYGELGDPKDWEHLQFFADGDGHFFAYTRAELMEIAKDSGLSSVQCTAFETPWISGHMKFRYLHRLIPYSALKQLDTLSRMLPWSQRYCHQLLMTGRKR